MGSEMCIRDRSSIAKKQEVRAILFEDLDPDSPTFGAMCLGTLGFEIAGERTADGLSLIHISEPTRRTPISYAVFCLKKKKKHQTKEKKKYRSVGKN